MYIGIHDKGYCLLACFFFDQRIFIKKRKRDYIWKLEKDDNVERCIMFIVPPGIFIQTTTLKFLSTILHFRNGWSYVPVA